MDSPGEDAVQKKFHAATDDWLQKAEKVQPFGRLIKPAEVAEFVAILLSERSGLMTGSIIDFDQNVIGTQGQEPWRVELAAKSRRSNRRKELWSFRSNWMSKGRRGRISSRWRWASPR
jgi:hypothetical protein